MTAERTVVTYHALLASATTTSWSENGLRDVRLSVNDDALCLDTRMIFAAGMTVVHGSSKARRDIELQSEHPSHVALHVGLRGSARPRVEATGRVLPSGSGDFVVSCLPASRVAVELDEDVHNEAFRVNLTNDYMITLTERFPELFESTIGKGRSDTTLFAQRSHVVPVGQMLDLVDDVMRSEVHGPVRRMFIEARVLELLARCLGGAPKKVPAVTELSQREVDRMVEARERLLALMAVPPTLDQLARAVGTNEYKLKRHFKAVFSESVHAFLLRRRLEHAKRLVLETDRAIKDIASEVGYAHVAHFSAAFRQRYGVPPSDMRQSLRKA
jgi:AraC-like DNA-binding protein